MTSWVVVAGEGQLPGKSHHFIGDVATRHARDIAGSTWSVGAETMDRDFTVYRNWKQYLGPLGVKHARLQSGWAKTEKERGKYDWAWLDEIVDDMVAQGVTPWICICYGNPIYSDGGGVGLGDGWPRGEESLAAWDRYVGSLVNRYQSRVNEWEIWNEPGLHSKKDNAKSDPHEVAIEYADFFIRTAMVVRREQPQARILGLSLPGIPLPFAGDVLKRLKERNALALLDELTYHPYNENPDASYAAVGQLREMLRSYAPNAIVRQGENGCPSVKGGFGAIAKADWTETAQAKWALRRLLGDLGRDIPTSYFSICDMRYPNACNHKGLLAINDDKTVHHVKQAYHSIQRITAIFDDTVHRIPEFLGKVDGAGKGRTYSMFGYRADSGANIVALWRDGNRPDEHPDIEEITVTLPGVTFLHPVWVDLLNGNVFAIDAQMWTEKDGVTTFRQTPGYDSPVLIAEESAIPLVSKHADDTTTGRATP
jgi:hypothetical protein